MEYFTFFIILTILALVFYVLAKNVKQRHGKLKEFLITFIICTPALIACKGWMLFAVIIVNIICYVGLYHCWYLGRPEDIMRDDD